VRLSLRREVVINVLGLGPIAPEGAPSHHAYQLPCKEACVLGRMASAAGSETHESLWGYGSNIVNLSITQQKKTGSGGRSCPKRSQKQLPLADGANSFAHLDC